VDPASEQIIDQWFRQLNGKISLDDLRQRIDLLQQAHADMRLEMVPTNCVQVGDQVDYSTLTPWPSDQRVGLVIGLIVHDNTGKHMAVVLNHKAQVTRIPLDKLRKLAPHSKPEGPGHGNDH